jgi:hypothetical protein
MMLYSSQLARSRPRALPGGDLRFASAPCCAVAVFKPRSCASRAAPPSRCAPLRPSFLVAPQSLLCWPLDSADVSFLLVCSVLSLLTLPHRPSASSRRVHPRVMRVCSHPARVFPSLPMSCALPVHCSVAIIVLHAAARPLLTAHVSFLSFHPCARVFAAAHSSHVRSFLPSSALPSLPVAASLAFSSTPFLRPARRISYSCPRDRLLLRRFLRFISARPRRAPRQATRSFPRFTRRCGVFFLSVIFFSAPWRPYQRRIAYCHRRGCPYPPRRPTIPWLPSRPAPSGLSTASPCFSSLTSAVPASRYCAGPRALSVATPSLSRRGSIRFLRTSRTAPPGAVAHSVGHHAPPSCPSSRRLPRVLHHRVGRSTSSHGASLALHHASVLYFHCLSLASPAASGSLRFHCPC